LPSSFPSRVSRPEFPAGVHFTQIGARELELIRDLIGSDDTDTPQTSYKPT